MADEEKEEREEEEERGLAERKAPDWFYRPLHEMDRMFEDMDSMFEDFFGQPLMRRRRGKSGFRSPAMDIQDAGDKYLIQADIPGINKDDLEVEIKEDRLSIKAESKEEKEEKGENYVRRERGYRSFYREIPLSENVLADEAEASYKNGVLEISLPKKEPEEEEGRKLEIK